MPTNPLNFSSGYALGSAIRYRWNQARREKEEEQLGRLQAMQYFAEHGDPEVRQIAVAGLAELLDVGVSKYKGDHLQQIRSYLDQRGGPATPGTVPERAGPPIEELAITPKFALDPQTGAPLQPGGQPPTGPPPSAALPSTSPTQGGPTPMAGPQAPGSAAAVQAQPPGPGVPVPGTAPVPTGTTPSPGTTPPMMGTTPGTGGPPAGPGMGSPVFGSNTIGDALSEARLITEQAGLDKPPAPDEGAIAEDLARQYGYTTAELSRPDFGYQGGLISPERMKLQQEYRTRLQEATRLAKADYRDRVSTYAASVRGLVGQVGTSRRAEAGQEAADARQARTIAASAERQAAAEARQQRTAEAAGIRGEKRAEASNTRTLERQARFTAEEIRQRGRATAAKLQASTDPLDQQKLRQDPGIIQRIIQQADEEADAAYQRLVGGPPGAPAGAGPATGTTGTDRMHQAAPARPAAPAGASASSTSGPPVEPLSPAEERRASSLAAKVRRMGPEGLTEDERQFMRRYVARKRQERGQGTAPQEPRFSPPPEFSGVTVSREGFPGAR